MPTKSKYIFFHNTRLSDYLPLQLPKLYIDMYEVKRVYFIKISVKACCSMKIKKYKGIIYKAKFLLNKTCLKNIYFFFIKSYIIYANIAWACANQTKLKKNI